MSPTEFWLIVVALAAVTGVCFYFIWRSLRRARIIEDTPTAKVRSAPQGYVELRGEGVREASYMTFSPLTGSECLWWRYKVERRRRTGKGSRWSKVRSGVSDSIFCFEDETGRCLIDPEGAEVTCSERDVWYSHSESPSASERSGSGAPSIGPLSLGTGRYRHTEERLLPGPIYTLGTFRTLNATDAPVREEVVALLREWKRDTKGLKQRFDADNDGAIDEHEWAQARRSARQQVVRERAERSAEGQTLHTLARPQDRRYPFLLSDHPQEKLARRYRLYAAAALAGFIAALGAAVWLLSSRFG